MHARMFHDTASFTRPANTTQYAAGDLVANSATAASVTPMTFTICETAGFGVIRDAQMYKSTDAVTTATFRLHLFKNDPTATALSNGDNGAIQVNTDETGYVGSIDFDMTDIDVAVGGNTATGVPFDSREIYFKLPAGSNALYGLLAATGTYTPASGEVFTVELIAEAL